MTTMFRKPKRNFRQRVVQNDSDEENDNKMETDITDDSKETTEEVVEPKVKEKKKKKDKSKSVLSFDHEEGDTTFQIKKSSHSKKVAKQLKKESIMEKTVDIKDNTKTVKTEKDSASKVSKIVKEEKIDHVEDRIKQLRDEFLTMNGDDAADLEENGSDDEGTFKKLLRRGEIPDATTIHQIRKQRQMARDAGDFVPIDDTVTFENKSSRLVRDDDNDKSDEDEEERVDFASNQAAVDRQRMKDNFLRAEHGSDEGSGEEREWEEQQIMKGVSALQQVSSTQDLQAIDQDSKSQDGMYSNGYHGNQGPVAAEGSLNSFGALPKMAHGEDLTLEILIKRLKDRLTTMEEVHNGHRMEADKVTQDLEDTKTSIENCENSVPVLENRFRFFQEMRGYVRDLVECLNEKVPQINNLEWRMNNLLKNRASKFVSRRQQDIQDQCQSYMANKAQVIMDQEDQVRQRRIAEREARRARRRRVREGKNISGHHDGLSSDDEENQSEITKYNQERDDIQWMARDLFEDVVDDFSSMDCVRERFYSWKRKYQESYTEAYIGLCLPKLVNPFVRLQLIGWNPLEEQCADLEEMRWYDALLFYGFDQADSDLDPEDEDVRLLPAIVEKIVVPKLINLAETQWDPISTLQTCRFVNLIKKLHRDYPTINGNSKNTQNLLKAIVSRMKKTLDDDVFMPLYPKTVLENRNSGHSVFFHRQSWTCVKLLGHFLSWSGIVSTDVIQKLVLDGLLNRYILLGLQTAPFNQETVTKCQAIVSAFPKEWFESLEGESTIPKLENFCRFLNFAAQLLDKAVLNASDIQKKDLREQMKQLSKLMVNIHALDHAMKLSDMYSLGSR